MTKILLLEDNDINRDMLTRRLQKRGYQVVYGVNGTEALPKAIAESPDLILMDMSMPVMDGWEATQQIKGDPHVCDIPVIALTAHAMAGDREKALAVGCDGYDTKPINFNRLVETIELLLPNSPEADPHSDVSAFSEKDEHLERLLLRHLRHELCTPINAIVGYSEILIDELPKIVDVQTADAQIADAQTADAQAVNAQIADADLAEDLRRVHAAGLQLLSSTDTILNPSQLKAHPVAQDINSFSARVRLELLTPLSTVMGYCEMLLEDSPQALTADLQRINAAAHRLLAMTNDIVNLAQQQLQMLSDQDAVASRLQLDSSANQVFVQTADRLIRSVKESTPKMVEGSILVVDDNELNCDLLSRQLERQGYTVTAVTNGAQALEMLNETTYDLILLDIFMPDMNGLDVLSKVKRHERWQTIPVIMISALDELNSVVHCIEMGADDFLSKPFNSILLQAKIKACLEKKKLQDQQSMYIAQRLIAGATPVPIIISRIEDGQILYANLAAESALGLPVQSLLQHSTLDFYSHPEERQAIVAALANQESVYRREIQCKRANGQLFWAAATLQPLAFDSQPTRQQIARSDDIQSGDVQSVETGNNAQTVLTVLYDISDRKEAEHALKLAEENYRSIFENARSGIYQSNPDGTFVRVNEEMAHIHGYASAAQMMGEVTRIGEQIYVNATDREFFQRLLNETGEVLGFEYKAYKQDGEIIWISENARTVRDAHGQTAYYEGVVEDITQRKLDEAALKREVKELRIEIDETKRKQSVAEITESDYFKEIQAEAESWRDLSDVVTDGSGEPPVDTSARLQPMILLVEDNEMNRDMLSRRLQKKGYDVEIAVNGQEGVTKTAQAMPDIVLMDMSLPVMDGWEATRNLKANPATQHIPVIALTAHAMASDREKAMAAGCDEYDTKPIDWPRLMSKVEALLK